MRILSVCGAFAVAAGALAAPIQIEATFLPEEHLIAGTMRVRWDASPTEAWFALLANLGREPNPYLSPLAQDGTYVAGFDPAWTVIERVAWSTPSGEEEVAFELLPAPPTLQTYSLDDVLLRVPLPPGSGELAIEFRTKFPHTWTGEPGRLGDVYTWRFGWHPLPFSPPEGGRWPLLLPAHDYRVALTVPAGWDAALPGEVSRAEDGEGTLFTVRFAEPVRSVSLFLAPKGTLRRAVLSCAGITVEAVALPGDEDKARVLATYVPEILASYAERYGPYPEGRLLLVEHPNEVGVAMTADGVVYLPRWLFRRLDLTAGGILSHYGRYILAHELAHLWWGIGIGVDLDAENWLSEGMAQYLSIRWYEDTFGAEGGNVFRFENKGLGEEMAIHLVGFVNLRQHLTELPYISTAFEGFDEAVVKPSAEVRYEQASAVRLYDKGYLVLRAAASLTGEDAFDGVLREAHAAARGGTFTAADLQKLLERTTGESWEPFFSQWVYGEAWADYAVEGWTRARDGEEHLTAVHLTRKGTGSMPVTVEVRGGTGERASQIWRAESTDTTIEFRTPFAVREVVVDPEHRALDTDRLNNTWPRKFVVALDRNELPLDAYLVEPDLASEGMTIRYLDWFGWGVYPQEMAVSGWVRYGREWGLSGWAAVGETLVGAMSLTRYLWATPHLGSPGTYWEAVGDLTLTVARRPEWTVGAELGWRASLTRAHSGGLSLLWVSPTGWRAEVRHTELFGVAPHTYLTLTGGAGVASPGLAPRFLSTLTEFRTKSLPDLPRGERKLFASGGIWLPPLRPDYSLGGAALVTEVRPRLYAALARLWMEGEREEIIPTYIEAGVEATIQVEALGGLLGFTVVVGIGWPLLPSGDGILYFGILGL
ncbi:MAG: hypothetical protein Kow0097_07880 [Candidatus Bipolaricaulota bacterium]|nr:hypothetical protein [Candidatus Bipolaricaulota bacterium]